MSRGVYHKFSREEREKWLEKHPFTALMRIAGVMRNQRLERDRRITYRGLVDVVPTPDPTEAEIDEVIRYCEERIFLFERRKDNHRARNARKFYAKWIQIIVSRYRCDACAAMRETGSIFTEKHSCGRLDAPAEIKTFIDTETKPRWDGYIPATTQQEARFIAYGRILGADRTGQHLRVDMDLFGGSMVYVGVSSDPELGSRDSSVINDWGGRPNAPGVFVGVVKDSNLALWRYD